MTPGCCGAASGTGEAPEQVVQPKQALQPQHGTGICKSWQGRIFPRLVLPTVDPAVEGQLSIILRVIIFQGWCKSSCCCGTLC